MSIPYNDVIDLAKRAGGDIMAIYEQDFAVYDKADESPLTEADLASHRRIVEGLARLTPNIPVLSEESGEISVEERLSWSTYWLIDPLDGTKEFIKKNGEFTVNIALIENNEPIFGVVYAPALDVLYCGKVGHWGYKQGAYKQEGDGPAKKIQVAKVPTDGRPWRVVGSRSHQSDEFKAFVDELPGAEIVSMGSSLKLCLVAEGAADLYPRLGPTSEWDTAAAHAVVVAAGGEVLDFETRKPLRYNTQEGVLNPFFIAQAARCSSDVVWHDMEINKCTRSERNGQRPVLIWFTGLSGSGKSTLADAVEKKLFSMGYRTYSLDGDNVRHGLCGDLGFGDQDRVENIRRVGEVGKLMVDAGLIVLASFISPFRRERNMVRQMLEPDEFIEVYLSTPLQECEKRDPKGLYEKARAGAIKDFTGISSPYEAPENPEVTVDSSQSPLDESVEQVIRALRGSGVLV